jgi:hypothetical protein
MLPLSNGRAGAHVKKSFRWRGLTSEETLERSTADILRGVRVITVCDREGDMYELFARAQDLKEPVLIRIVQNRMTVENKRILDEIRKKRRQGRVEATIPRDSRSSVPEWKAEWKLLYCIANKVKKEPKKPYMMKEAVDYLGWLGGPKRAPSDGPPGVKTIWIGLMKLYILLTYREYLT